MKDAQLRINKYEKKLSGPHLGAVFKNYLPYMVQNYAEWANLVCEVENAIKSILDTRGVFVAVYPMYLSFGREILRLKRQFGGVTLLQRAELAKAKWSDYGLDPDILEIIKNEILGLTSPPSGGGS